MKIKNREELIAKQEEYRASLNSQRKQILLSLIHISEPTRP